MVIIAVSLPILLIMAAIAVNVAYMELVRTELRASTDLSARAAARSLSIRGQTSDAIAAAQDIAAENRVANQPFDVATEDLAFGTSTRNGDGVYVFVEGGSTPNAVRLNGNRAAGSVSGAVSLFLPITGTTQFEPQFVAEATQVDRDVMLVLDRSGSMVASDEDGNSTGWVEGDSAPANSLWARCVWATSSFIYELEDTQMDEKLGLVTYGNNGSIDVDLAFDYTAIETRMDWISDNYTNDWTNIGEGIDMARIALQERGFNRPWAKQSIIVMTDGVHNTGTMTPQQAATAAAAVGITIHTITFGGSADQAQMQEVATLGGGQFWHAPKANDLRQIFLEIANNSPTLLTK